MHPPFVSHRRLLRWTMVCLVWFAALAPTLSTLAHWLQGDAVVGFGEICSVNNAAAGAGGEDAPASADPLAHCPFCLLQAHLPVLPGSVAFVLPDLRGHEAPALFLQAGHTLHAWVAAQPRGPPALG